MLVWGGIAIGGGIAYGIATNNNATVADNKNGSEIVTTYNEKDKEEGKDKEFVLNKYSKGGDYY